MTPHGPEWRAVALLGLPNMLGWHVMSIFGVKALASGRAAILGFTMPIWTVLIGVGLLGERLTGRVAFAASAVALAIGLLVSDELRALAGRPVGVLWMGGAAVSWAIGTLMMRRMKHTLPVEALTVWMMIGSAACIWVIAALTEPLPTLCFTPAMWASLAYGVLVGVREGYAYATTSPRFEVRGLQFQPTAHVDEAHLRQAGLFHADLGDLIAEFVDLFRNRAQESGTLGAR